LKKIETSAENSLKVIFYPFGMSFPLSGCGKSQGFLASGYLKYSVSFGITMKIMLEKNK